MKKEQFQEAQETLNNISFLSSQLDGCKQVQEKIKESDNSIDLIPFSFHGFEAKINDPRFYRNPLQLTKNEALELLEMRISNLETEIQDLEIKFSEI